MTKIAILSSEFPPRQSGLADYTAQVAVELIRQGHEVCVWSAQQNPEVPPGVSIRFFELPWNSGQLDSMGRDIFNWSPESLVIQYTPQSIAPERLGVHLGFPFWVRRLRSLLKKPVAITAHELNYPFEFTIRGLLLGLPQLIQFYLLVFVADVLFFTTAPILARISKVLFWKKNLYWLPVGANVEYPESSIRPSSIEMKNQLGIKPHQKVFLYFGGLHPTHLMGHIKAAYLKAREVLGPNSVKLVCIGVKSANIHGHFSTPIEIEALKDILIFNFLSPLYVSQWLAAADLVLAPFMDGISTRRSSAMAAFQHGKAVLTTFGSSSPGSIEWDKFCVVVPVQHKDTYATLAVSLLTNATELGRLGAAAKKAYDSKFTWKTIVTQLISRIR